MRYGAGIVKWMESELERSTERLGKSWQWIKNYTLEVISTGCMYLGWKDEEDWQDARCVWKQKKTALNAMRNATLNLWFFAVKITSTVPNENYT